MAAQDVTNPIQRYRLEVQQALALVPEPEIARVIAALLAANRADRSIYLLGNGGSAATAAHFACDLAKGAIVPGQPRFRALALADNLALLTAWANDVGYDQIFAQQLAGLLDAHDVVIAISASGNSPNVLN